MLAARVHRSMLNKEIETHPRPTRTRDARELRKKNRGLAGNRGAAGN